MKSLTTILVLLTFSLTLGFWTGPDPSLEDDAKREFVGTSKCKTCHLSAKKGAQYKQWQETAHANAYQTLGSEQAKTIGLAVGIEDPASADECLKCHVTGHGVDASLLGAKYDKADGVGCESCHGAGGDYWTKSVMKEITAGTTDGASVGLVTPDEQLCRSCHNEESPTFKGFEYEAMSSKVSHPYPEGFRESYGESGDGGE